MEFQLTKEEWEQQVKAITRIEHALLGDKEMGQSGIVYRVNQHEKKLSEIEALKNKGWGFVASFGIISGIIGTSFFEGFKSLYHNISGNRNTVIGYKAGYNLLGTGNVCIGDSAGINSTTCNGKLFIGNSDNPYLITGDFSNDSISLNGYVKIVDGTQGANKVFTSDANGLGSWQTPSGGGLWTLGAGSYSTAATYTVGKVSIGNSTPRGMLDVVDYSTFTTSFYLGTYSPTYYTLFQSNAGIHGDLIINNMGDSKSLQNIYFRIDNDEILKIGGNNISTFTGGIRADSLHLSALPTYSTQADANSALPANTVFINTGLGAGVHALCITYYWNSDLFDEEYFAIKPRRY